MLRASGGLGGADGLDVGDAACVAMAWFEERFNATELTLNPEGHEEWMRAARVGQPDEAAMAGTMESAEELRADMARRAALKKTSPTK